LWHGASWNYIIWGAWHGLFLVLERAFLIKAMSSIGRITRVGFTFVVVVIGWIFFRVEDLTSAWGYTLALFGGNERSVSIPIDIEWMVLGTLAFAFSFFLLIPRTQKIQDAFFGARDIGNIAHVLMTLVAAILFILSLTYITASGFNPFIYFRF
jgi:alginate O-acetyltransferase complex protein AlgI